jgi:hypothetical protein
LLMSERFLYSAFSCYTSLHLIRGNDLFTAFRLVLWSILLWFIALFRWSIGCNFEVLNLNHPIPDEALLVAATSLLPLSRGVVVFSTPSLSLGVWCGFRFEF